MEEKHYTVREVLEDEDYQNEYLSRTGSLADVVAMEKERSKTRLDEHRAEMAAAGHDGMSYDSLACTLQEMRNAV